MSFHIRGSCLVFLSLSAVMTTSCSDDGSSGRPINRPPGVLEPQVTTDEDVPVVIHLLDGATDLDGDPLTVTQVSAGDHRTELVSDGIVTLTPKQDFNGTISVAFTVSDGIHDVARHATVTVRPVNDAPIATGSTASVRRATSIVLEGHDVDGDALTYEVVTAPAHGTVNGIGPEMQYIPATDFAGEDSFTYRVLDATTASTPAEFHVQITADAAPVARADAVTVDEGMPLLVTLRGSDGDGDPLAFEIVTPPAHGTLSGNAPNLTYTPPPDFNGNDSLEFSVSDGFLRSAVATVAIDVTPVNDAPVATPQTVNATEDTSSTITLAGSDVEGDVLTFQIQGFPLHGSLSGSGATWTYTPQANYAGPDSFSFVASDDARSSTSATVTIDVAAVNDPPVAGLFSRILNEDTSVATTLTSSDIDGGPGPVRYAIVTPPVHGTLSGIAPLLTYVPDANYNGDDSFTYTASDGAATSASATVTLTVFPVHDSPVAISSSVTTAEDTPVAITLQGSNPDGGAIDFFLDTVPSDGVLTGSGANLTYTPAPNTNGTRSFRFRTFAGGELSAPATVTITITPVNDPPTTVDDYLEANPSEPLRFSVISNDFDLEGDSFELTSIDEPAHGTLENDGNGFVYTPGPGFAGIDVFTYQVADSHGASSVGSAHIGVGQFPPGAPTEAIATAGPRVDFDTATSISDDGRYIAFNSNLPLVGEDTNGVHDIYFYDRGRRVLTRITTAMGGGDANGPSVSPQVSADGRYVVFRSSASTLVAGDTNGRFDIFHHDRVTGETVRVSVATGGGQGSGDSVLPKISDDANLIAFRSDSFDLVANDANGVNDIFLRDVAAGTTTRISVSIIDGDGDLASLIPAISGDGRYVAFASSATNLVPGDTNNATDTFVRDRTLGTTTRISVSTTGGEANASCSSPSISRDGRFISFLSAATNLVTGAPAPTQLYVRDTQAQTTSRPLSSSFTVVSGRLSADGRYMTIESTGGVRIHDRFAAITLTPPGSSTWEAPAISGNGRYVSVFDEVSGKVVVTANTL
jgi:Tol biopolymer transport system component